MSEAINKSNEPEEHDEPNNEAEELSEGYADSITAASVNMRQSGANLVDADVVDMRQSAAGQINAQQVSVQQAIVASADSATLAVNQGVVGLSRAEEISVIGGAVGASVAANANLQESQVVILAAQEVRSGPVNTVFLVSGKVEGPVETMFDTRQTILFGMVAGLCAGLIMVLKNMIFSRR